MSGLTKIILLVATILLSTTACTDNQSGQYVSQSENPPIGKLVSDQVIIEDSIVAFAACKRLAAKSLEGIVPNSLDSLELVGYQSDSLKLLNLKESFFVVYYAHSPSSRTGIVFPLTIQDSTVSIEREGMISYFLTSIDCQSLELNTSNSNRVFFEQPHDTNNSCKYVVSSKVSVSSSKGLFKSLKAIFG